MRMGSKRLPNKAIRKIAGKMVIERVIERLKRSCEVDELVLATTDQSKDDVLVKIAERLGIGYFRGSENDVLDRYYQCSLRYPQYNNIIRIMGDCPLVDPVVIDETVAFFEKNNYDFASNAERNGETFPDGMDVDVSKKSVLAQAAKKAKLNSEREHVIPYIRENKKFKQGYYSAEHNFSHFRLVLDEKNDFAVIKFLIKNSKLTDSYLDYISLLTKNPAIMFKNRQIKRNQGYLKSLKQDALIKQ